MVTSKSGDQLASDVGCDSILQTTTLESLRSAAHYHDWLASLAEPYLGDDPIELGSGLGDYVDRWLSNGTPRITATDLDSRRLEVLRGRFGPDPRVRVERVDALAPRRGSHSSLVAFNVLEHISMDVDALRGARTLVRPGGYVVMLVPAFNFAMGRFDREVGHARRYTVPSLSAVFESAGLTIEKVHYVNAPGLATWFIAVRLLRMTPMDGALVRLWDRHVTRRVRRWEAKHPPPFGQSVFCVGRSPG